MISLSPLKNAALAVVGALILAGAAKSLSGATPLDWSRFRGPNGSGISAERGLPIMFGPETNLAWKVAAPAGNSSPIAVGDRIFLAGYEKDRRLICCHDLKDGSRLWE